MLRKVKGLEDPSKLPDLFAELVASREWDYWDLEKLAGRNFLRILEEVEKASL
jgi:membrane dipeptidase